MVNGIGPHAVGLASACGADAVRQLLAGFVARSLAEYRQPEGRTRRG